MFGGFAFFFVNGAPFLINVVDDAYKHQAFALKAAHWSLAGFAGSLVGGILPRRHRRPDGWTLAIPSPIASRLPWRQSSWRYRRPRPCAFVRCRQRLKRTLARRTQWNAAMGNGWAASVLMLIVIMTVIRLFQVAGSATAMVYFNVYMDQHLAVSTALIGAMAAIGRLTGVPTALLTPWLVQRWGNTAVVIGASSMVATSA